MAERDVVRRAGGRSARVRQAVLTAASELAEELGESRVAMSHVAARSGVHPTSLYRRWGTISALLLDAAVERLGEQSPLPDQGSLRADLIAYAEQVDAGLRSPGGLRLLQAVVAAADAPGDPGPQVSDLRRQYLDRRAAQIQRMLDRDAAHGGPSLHWSEVVDGLLAPIYLRRLFGIDVEPDLAALLADRVLAAGGAAVR